MAKKKEVIVPSVCVCGRTPIVARKKGTGWPTRDAAVEDWNEKTAEARHRLNSQKGGRKK